MPDYPKARRAFLVNLYDEEGENRQYEIGPLGLLVGRSNACDIIMHSAELAPRHAYLYIDGNSCFIEDLSTADDVYVNGRQYLSTVLHHGDTVKVGRLKMRLSIAEPDAIPPTPDEIDTPARTLNQDGVQSETDMGVSSLAVAAMVFAVLAYQHWSFGICAVILACATLRETQDARLSGGRGVAWAALAIALLGGALNAWFEDVNPRGSGGEQEPVGQSQNVTARTAPEEAE